MEPRKIRKPRKRLRKISVDITETYQRTVRVEAYSESDAIARVEQLYRNGDMELDKSNSDLSDYEISIPLDAPTFWPYVTYKRKQKKQ